MFSVLLFVLFSCFLNSDAVVQDVYWREYVRDEIPHDALEAAPGVYIGQVLYSHYVVPATIYILSNITAVNDFDGKRIYNENVKILCTGNPDRFYWEFVKFTTSNGEEMKNVVKGGYQSNLAAYVYVGKVKHEGEWKIGRTIGSENAYKGLYIWNKDAKQVRLYDFYLLKYLMDCN